VQDRRLINYREEPGGLLINLRPENQMLLAQYYLNTYGYAGKERVVIATSGGSKEKLHLYNATSIQHLVGRKVYKADYKNVNASDIIRIDALNVNTSITYSKTFLNSFYESFDESSAGDLFYNELTNKKAHGSWYYFMFNSIDLVDLSENGIKYQGRIPTFYPNGKLKSVGLTDKGKKVGKWEYYNESGVKTLEEKYVIGNVFEYKIEYNAQGIAINEKSYWTNGLVWQEKSYNPETGILTTISYDEGIITEEIDAKAKDLFDEAGKWVESRDYEDGILVKTTKY
jgi:antitoxin component YwqK of YwqJK toxin-antitoxin module